MLKTAGVHHFFHLKISVWIWVRMQPKRASDSHKANQGYKIIAYKHILCMFTCTPTHALTHAHTHTCTNAHTHRENTNCTLSMVSISQPARSNMSAIPEWCRWQARCSAVLPLCKYPKQPQKLLKSLVTMSMVAYFILWASMGNCVSQN